MIRIDIAYVRRFLVLFLTCGEIRSIVGYKMINIRLREGLTYGKCIRDMVNGSGKILG